MIKNKLLKIDSFVFEKSEDLPSADGTIDSVYISGYASTTDPDRASDVIVSAAWKTGMENYLKNPIVLAYHDHSSPIGRVVEHKVDSKGLWIKARISAAAEDVFNLIKDGVLTAFSVGFMVLDAEYDSLTEIFVVKELELREISVVAVPCNQDTLFSLSKSFENDEDYKEFKMQFSKSDESAKGLETPATENSATKEVFGMTPEELQKALEKATADAVTKAMAAQEEVRKAAEEAAKRKQAEEAELEARIQKALAAVTPSTTGADRLLDEVTKRIESQVADSKKALDGLEASIAEKAKELAQIQASKMLFNDKAGKDDVTYAEKEKAVLLSKISRKSIEDTKFGKQLLQKALGAGAASGAHLPSQTWEHEVSLNMEEEVRRRLVVAPLMRQINMQTNVMTFPLNPEAGYGTWVGAATSFGTTASAGATQTHTLKEVTLNAYKLATNEYLTFEEDEDSLIIILPIVRDAMVRRLAKSVDKAYLLGGAVAGTDPIKGLSIYDATSVVVPTSTGAASVANLRALRKDLGAWGLDPSEITYIVSTEVYYDLLDDTLFQTVDKVGDRASLLTGQVGSIGNSPVLVSAEFPTKAGGTNTASTNIGAICFATRNFLVGNQRGLRFDTQDLVEYQRRVLVASLRTGMTQVTTNLGQAVSTLRWS